LVGDEPQTVDQVDGAGSEPGFCLRSIYGRFW